MRVRNPLRATAAAAVLALGLAACGGGNGDGDGDTTAQESPEAGQEAGQEGGTFSVDLTEPQYLAPASNCYESECSAVLDLVNDPLVNVDFETGELVFDGLAENIEASEDQTTWTITLKEGREFHNGEPVNSDAFIRAWNYSADPKNAQQTAGFMSRIEGAGDGGEMSGLTKVDDQTFEVTLGGPFSQFGAMLSYAPAFAPIAQECLDDVKACNESPIGTGPYQMDGEWRHDEGITVTKWADYQGDAPANADTIDFKMYTSPTAALRDLQSGNLDLIPTITSDVYLDAKGALGDRILEDPSATLTYVGFPVDQAPFDNAQVRQAMSLSVDRQLIVDQILNGLAQPATDIPTPPIPGHRDDACAYCEYDPEQAKQLLEESGVNPEGTTVTYYFNSDAGHDQWVEAAARQIQENLGFDYRLKATEWAQYLELLDGQKFTGPFRLGWSLDYPSPENYIKPIVGTGGDSNYTGYSNPELDDLVTQGDEAGSVEEGIELYQQAGDLALEDMPIMPMWSGVNAAGYSENISNVRFDVGQGEIAFGEVTVNQ